ncbi:hypothetical protein ADK44_19000, partial [Streptomyces rimosus subsp. rimosus]
MLLWSEVADEADSDLGCLARTDREAGGAGAGVAPKHPRGGTDNFPLGIPAPHAAADFRYYITKD